MSSLICFSTEEFAVIATDTLGVTTDGEPAILSNKASYLQTLKTVICGTGAGGFHSLWAEYVNSRMILLGIDNLDYHSPGLLRTMWQDFKEKFNVTKEQTVTIYHIGLSLETGGIKRFAYRSTNNFISEEVQHGWFYKPECSVPPGDDVLHIVKEMMFEQRAIQELKARKGRIYIGGQINVIILEKDVVRFMTIGEFPDFPDVVNKLFQPA